jgi:hypothetical protein
MVKASPLFNAWDETKYVSGQKPSPVDLLLLGSLHYLGRGWTFDDLDESTAISEETHHCFFHIFVLLGCTFLFDKYVTFLACFKEAEEHQEEFREAGFKGCLCRIDRCDASCGYAPVFLQIKKLTQRICT